MNTDTITQIIIAVALGAPILRYAVAFQQAEPMLMLWGRTLDISPVTGIAFGISYEAAAFVGMREAMKARRRGLKTWWWPLAGALLQTAVGIGIVLPVFVAELRGVSLLMLFDSLWLSLAWLWSGLVLAATLLCFVTVSLALAVQPQKRAKSKPALAKPCFICATCGYEAKTQQGLNAHQRLHKDK